MNFHRGKHPTSNSQHPTSSGEVEGGRWKVEGKRRGWRWGLLGWRGRRSQTAATGCGSGRPHSTSWRGQGMVRGGTCFL